jgi:hypothetical protein
MPMSYAHDDDALEPELVPAAMAGLATAGETLTRMRNVDADVRALHAEIDANRERLSTAFERGWAHWRDRWFQFFRENQGLAQRMWPGTIEEVEAFARRLQDWRSAAERAGLELASPDPSRPPPQRPIISVPSVQVPNFGRAARDAVRELGEVAREVGPAVRGLVPNFPSIPGLPPVLGPNGPLSVQFWESVRPVAIAGAFAVGGLGLLWILWNLRMATAMARPPSIDSAIGGASSSDGAQQSGQLNELARLAPMLLSRGLIR